MKEVQINWIDGRIKKEDVRERGHSEKKEGRLTINHSTRTQVADGPKSIVFLRWIDGWMDG